MSEEVEIEVLLSSKMHANAPSFQLLLDDILVEEGKIFEKQIDNEHKVIKWKGNLAEGDHTIRIKYFNKTNADTVIDNVSKEILRDQLLHIDGISIDSIELGFLAYKLSKFYPDRNIRPDLDKVIPQRTTLGFNGEWQLKFQVPTYLWFLENF
jgi:hypothetical protein